MSSNQVDLSSLLNIESSYVQSIGTVTPGEAAIPVQPIIGDLNNINKSLQTAQATTGNILDHQNDLRSILDQEQNRLEQKKQSVDGAITTQERMIQLNQSYQKRYASYTKIVIVLTMTIILILGVLIIFRFFPFIPSIVIYIICTIISLIALVYIGTLYMDIRTRTVTNYDQIRLNNKPKTLTPPIQSSPTPASNAEYLANLGIFCSDQSCCSSGTIWDPQSNKCTIGGLITPSASRSIQPFTLIGQTTPYSVVRPQEGFEFNKYAKM
jgi:VIT1/CCC1 family predicted Fe2+/Mn2+ transporter